jgi:DNA polymerase-1|tara:strand:- start:2050 stop:3048 length:999 start_codon:yes stop_codon:yes gene_type:complete
MMNNSTTKKRILIFDALNAYLRAYIVDPSLSTNGDPIGGIKGFIKILQRHVRETSPDQIVIVWDGPNGSRKRKSVDKNYKAGRKPIRLNRAFHNLTDDEELRNKMWQQTRLIEYFNNMPIIQFMLPEVEADDVIAFITQMPEYKGWQKIVVSNDKDFMQLCDDETILWRPTQNEILNKNSIIEKTGVHPVNMALARAIVGDTSDNLPGVKGAGFATVSKRLNFLSDSKIYTVDDVIEFCEKTSAKLKIFNNITENRKLIEHNYKMMQLYAPQLSVQGKDHVRYSIENFECDFNRTDVLKMMREDGFGELNWEALRAGLNKVRKGCTNTTGGV